MHLSTPDLRVPDAEGRLVSGQHVTEAGDRISEFGSRAGSTSGHCPCTGKYLWTVPHRALSGRLCDRDIETETAVDH